MDQVFYINYRGATKKIGTGGDLEISMNLTLKLQILIFLLAKLLHYLFLKFFIIFSNSLLNKRVGLLGERMFYCQKVGHFNLSTA